MYTPQFLERRIHRVRKRWIDFRDGIVIDDLKQSYSSAQRLKSSDFYIPADFLFTLAGYSFARQEREQAENICIEAQSLYPGYDPSQRFTLTLPKKNDSLEFGSLIEEVMLYRSAENFLSRFLDVYPKYNFEDFTSYFKLSSPLTRQSLMEKLSKESPEKKG